MEGKEIKQGEREERGDEEGGMIRRGVELR